MRKLTATLILLIACAPAFAQVAYIEQRVGKRVVVLIVKRETAERLLKNRLTEADRKDLQEAWNVALGDSDIRQRVCISHDSPHVNRFERCPAQNIRRGQ